MEIIFVLDIWLLFFMGIIHQEYEKAVIQNILNSDKNLNELPTLYRKSIRFHKKILKTELDRKITDDDLIQFYIYLINKDTQNYKCVPKKYKNHNQILKMKIIKF